MSRIEALLKRMTLAEKVGQLTMSAAGSLVTGPRRAGDCEQDVCRGFVGHLLNLSGAERLRSLQRLAVEESRLGIPLLFAMDVMHGYRTLFPVALAEAGLFDPDTWALTAREAAEEAGHDGVTMTFSPMLDVARDPRWGRIVEGPGEDPWVAARMAEAKVRGIQGESLAAPGALAAVAKHFCAYGAVTAGREYASVDISDRTLLEVYVPPFAAAVRAGVAAIMPAFTDIAGMPTTANRKLLRTLLRDRLGFTGVLVSDYNSIGELIQHGVAADLAQAAALALHAGVDIDMMADAYRHGLPVALERNLVEMAQIDAAVRRVLALKERLGLFEDPYERMREPEKPERVQRRRQLARSVAARAAVLLTHRGEVLPLSPDLACLAVIGPLADAPAEMRGPWGCVADPAEPIGVLEGVRAAWPHSEVRHAAGVPIQVRDESGIAAAVALIDGAQAVVLCLGESADMSGEAASRAHLALPGSQRVLAEAVLECAQARAVPVIAVLFCGRPLIVPWLMERADAVLAAWFPGSEAGHAIADLLSGRVSPSGRTPVGWPRAVGQIPLGYSQRPTGRPADPANPYSSRYIDVPNEPLFPFGHGLTYGRFALSDLRVTPQVLREQDTLEVRVQLANEGTRRAQETVFLFVHDRLASLARPSLELKGWARIDLAPGAEGSVEMRLPARELRFVGDSLTPQFEPGEVEILVGPCADRARLLATRIQLV